MMIPTQRSYSLRRSQSAAVAVHSYTAAVSPPAPANPGPTAAGAADSSRDSGPSPEALLPAPVLQTPGAESRLAPAAVLETANARRPLESVALLAAESGEPAADDGAGPAALGAAIAAGAGESAADAAADPAALPQARLRSLALLLLPFGRSRQRKTQAPYVE